MRKYAFPQNFRTRKLGEITAFYGVIGNAQDSDGLVIHFSLFMGTDIKLDKIKERSKECISKKCIEMYRQRKAKKVIKTSLLNKYY